MPRHRELNLKKFEVSVDSDLLERYFKKKLPDASVLPPEIILDGSFIEKLLRGLQDNGQEVLVKKMLEDFTKIYDTGHKTMNILVQSADLYNIEHSGEESKAGLAMRLFLDHPEAFQYAYDLYCYFASSSKIREYEVEGAGLKFIQAKLDEFREIISSFYGKQEKGYNVALRRYEDGPEYIIVVDRGSYLQVKGIWEKGQIKTITYRPANEDVLIFNKNTSILSIKAPYGKDHKNYRASFYKAFLGGEIEPEPKPDALYTLEPVQDGSFDYDGDETIRYVKLLSLKLKFPSKSSVVLTSKDLLDSLEYEFSDYSIKSGEIVHAKFRFRVILEDKEKNVTVEISPPNVTDLYKKQYADIIAEYLIKQKVKLK